MLLAFVTDKDAMKFIKRKIQVWQEEMSVKRNQLGVIQFPACRSFQANDMYVIDI